MSAQSLKPGWKIMKFGDFVECIREQGQPTEEDSRSYIGLEHLDTGSLHVKRWGSDADLKGQKLRMKKGDLLFAKRNAYLRRVAIAPHDGFFSAHGMVLRPKGKDILPEFLPFFLQSDIFMERAIEISVGSLSPTINWKTLRVQEFPLPPLDEQNRIAGILWAADETSERYLNVLANLEIVKAVECDLLFQDKSKLVKIQSLVDSGILLPPQDGNHGNDHPKAEDYVESGIPFVMASNLANHKLDIERCKFLPKALADKLRIGFSLTGDVLLSHKGTVGEVAIVPSLHMPYVMLTPQVTYYRVKDQSKLNPRFLFFSFLSKSFQRTLARFSAQSTRAYIGITAQRQFEIPLPDIEVQNAIVDRLDSIKAERESLHQHLANTKKVATSYLNNVARSVTLV